MKIKAKVYFLHKLDGRRVFSQGYGPQLLFDYQSKTTAGYLYAPTNTIMFDGEEHVVEFTLQRPDIVERYLSVGKRFQGLEGSRVVLEGVILQVFQ